MEVENHLFVAKHGHPSHAIRDFKDCNLYSLEPAGGLFELHLPSDRWRIALLGCLSGSRAYFLEGGDELPEKPGRPAALPVLCATWPGRTRGTLGRTLGRRAFSKVQWSPLFRSKSWLESRQWCWKISPLVSRVFCTWSVLSSKLMLTS